MLTYFAASLLAFNLNKPNYIAFQDNEKVIEETQEEVSEEAPEEALEEVPEETPEEDPEEAPEEAPGEVPEEAPGEVPEEDIKDSDVDLDALIDEINERLENQDNRNINIDNPEEALREMWASHEVDFKSIDEENSIEENETSLGIIISIGFIFGAIISICLFKKMY